MDALVRWVMLALRHLPLPLLRGLGFVLGNLLWLLAGKRRKVVLTNLALCFPTAGACRFCCRLKPLGNATHVIRMTAC